MQGGRAVACLFAGLAVFCAVWLAVLAYTSLSPPVDNIEQLTWVRSLEWGYYKHPPAATWLFWLPATLLGATAWASYLTGAAFTLGAIVLQWRLLSQLRGMRYATLASTAVLCVTYYNDRLYYYNHNVALMFFATLAAVFCWKAHSTGKLRWWVVLGVVIGLGSLAKYQMAVVVACVLVHWLHMRGWRVQRHRTGLLLAGLVALVLFVPHLQWLRAHDFAPVHYALDTSLAAGIPAKARDGQALHWLVDQLFNRALPAWLLLGVAWFFGASRRTADHAVSPAVGEQQAAPAPGRALLVIWGVVPLVFMPAVGLAVGADLQLQWGTSFLLFAVPAVMELLATPERWSRYRMRPILHAFLALQALMIGVNFLTSPRGPSVARDHHWRSFDAKELTHALEGPARQALAGIPVCVISGPAAIAGAVALEMPERPLVLIDGRFDQSPWVDARLRHPCGVLELSGDGSGHPVGQQFPGISWRVARGLQPDRR